MRRRVADKSKKLLMVTDVPFWKRANGSHLRIQSLLLALHRLGIEVVVWHLGQVGLSKRKSIRQQYPRLGISFMQVPFLDPWGQWWAEVSRGAGASRDTKQDDRTALSAPNPMGRALADFEEPVIASRLSKRLQRWRPDVVLLEYVSLSYLAKAVREIPDRPAVVIDTHDIQSIRQEYFEEQGWPSWLDLTGDQERSALNLADALIAIQSEDAKVLRDWIPDRPVVVAGHPSSEALRVPEVGFENEQVVGMIAGDGLPNCRSLEHFFEQVWLPLRSQVPQARFRLAGGICTSPQAERWRQVPGVELMGRVEEVSDFYRQIAIAINPTRVPSGLKIQSTEAIGAGRPLVTDPPGGVGLEGLHGISVAVADNSAAWIEHLKNWLLHPQQHRLASRKALEYASKVLAPEVVFEDLRHLICELG